MRITLVSVMVDDQTKALAFYTELLGFVKKQDVPVGPDRFLTVVSPDRVTGPVPIVTAPVVVLNAPDDAERSTVVVLVGAS